MSKNKRGRIYQKALRVLSPPAMWSTSAGRGPSFLTMNFSFIESGNMRLRKRLFLVVLCKALDPSQKTSLIFESVFLKTSRSYCPSGFHLILRT